MIKCNIQLHVIFHVNIWLIFFFYSGLRNWIGKFQKCYNYSLKVAKSWYCSLKKKKHAKVVCMYYRTQLQWWCVLFKNSDKFIWSVWCSQKPHTYRLQWPWYRDVESVPLNIKDGKQQCSSIVLFWRFVEVEVYFPGLMPV